MDADKIFSHVDHTILRPASSWDEVKKLCEEAVKYKTAGNRILKVIVETCFLTGDEKIAVCRCVTEGGADYIKTSTGFGSAGAQLEDITLFRKHIGENVKIKASGGIKTREDFEKFLEAGCERIGASAAVSALGSEESPCL